jgi:transposase
MARGYILILEEAERVTLEEMRDHHPKAYLGERAAALLKVEAGASIQAVADRGLLHQREWETVSAWVKRYEQEGIGGLYLRKGRRRKPAFPPSVYASAAPRRA